MSDDVFVDDENLAQDTNEEEDTTSQGVGDEDQSQESLLESETRRRILQPPGC